MKKIAVLLLLVFASAQLVSAHYYVPRFDPNQDGVSNIVDVTDLIDYLLSGSSDSGVTEETADVDRNGRIRAADVTLMIDYLLDPDYYDDPRYGPQYPEPVIPEGSEIFTVNGVSFAMVPVDTVDEDGNLVHKFSLGLTEVTDELWTAVMGSSPSHDHYTRFPVNRISWYDAYEFIDSLNRLTGRQFRLPYAEEWEYAARGGLLFHQYLYAGSDDLSEVAWCAENLPYADWLFGSCPVALLKPNELGFYDLCGNVYEWCHNVYGMPESINFDDKAQIVGGGVSGSVGCCLISYSLKSTCRANRSSNFVIRGSAYGNFGMRLAL